MEWVLNYWVWFAILFSMFWGIYGYNYEQNNGKNEQRGAFVSEFIGSFAGWYCFNIFVIRQKSPVTYSNMETADMLLILGAFVGMAGYSFEIAKLIHSKLKR